MKNQRNITLESMLPKGTVLHDTFRIDSYLASGGFGNTYVATHILLGTKHAIKEFFMREVCHRESGGKLVRVGNSENIDNFKHQREKFKKEARRLNMLNHRNIVRVNDLFEENGTAYYAMDYVEGEDLQHRLERMGHPLSEGEVRQLLSQVLDALETVHSKDIWHLDLKPANIMLAKDGTVKLIDFGASKQFDKENGGFSSSSVALTTGFAPLEQIEQNQSKFGPWTDFYALGATLYNLLTHKTPPQPGDIIDDHTSDKHLALPLPSSVSKEMKDLVLQLMNPDRTQRPQNVAEIKRFLNTTTIPKQSSIDDLLANIVKRQAVVEQRESTLLKTPVVSPRHSPAVKNQESKASKPKASKKKRMDFFDIIFLIFCACMAVATIVGLYYSNSGSHGGSGTSINLAMADSLVKEGINYYKGQSGYPKDYQEAVKRFQEAAEQGYANAQNCLGDCYKHGNGVIQDYNEAVKWYRKAAEQGFASAQNNLGNCYYNGTGVEQDYNEAVKWYRKAAEQGYSWAQYNLGNCYMYSYSVEKDYTEAVKWYRKAADQGLYEAQKKLGNCYLYGFGVEKNSNEAVKWYRKSADKGHAIAQFDLGNLYFYGYGLLKKDYTEAVKWFRKAADQGHAKAQLKLARCYKNGYGVDKDYTEGAKWYRKAAEQGDKFGQLNLADCYEKGIGVPKDKSEAIEWYHKAADQGLHEAKEALKRLGKE